MDHAFRDTGSQITTIHKDLQITMDMARQYLVPLFTAAAAHELFQSGASLFPDKDNGGRH